MRRVEVPRQVPDRFCRDTERSRQLFDRQHQLADYRSSRPSPIFRNMIVPKVGLRFWSPLPCYGHDDHMVRKPIRGGGLPLRLPGYSVRRCLSGCGWPASLTNTCPADPQAEFSHGKVLSLLLAARLFNPVALVNVGRWAADSGADILWGLPVEKINDDRLGRSVDAFFDQRHSILASVALHVSQEFGVPLKEIHYDPTHLVLHGVYEGSEARGAVIDRWGRSS